ncbi:MAG: radical SAM protein [bacterium]
MFDSIKEVYNDKFPPNYINDVNGWGFSKEVINNNIGKLLTLDIDFGSRCSLNCPHCFRKNNYMNKTPESRTEYLTKDLSFLELTEVLLQAKKLGLRSVKFLGKGEPFECDKLISLLEFLYNNEIIPLIFTKGHIIGDDDLVKKYFSKYDVNNGLQLVKVLKKYNASILLGFNSFNKDIQNKMVGDGHIIYSNKRTYFEVRNNALKLLIDEGFNQGNPTQLCLATNPLTKENINEIFEIYKWGRERNIYMIVTPTMISGRAQRKYFWKDITPSSDEIINLYTKIYSYNIEKGIQDMKQIESEGISGYAGGHPCNQVSVGMYLTINGKVFRCPGDEVTYFGNVKYTNLKKLWENSENYKRCGLFNCGCPPKIGKSIPLNLFTQVLNNLKNKY